MRLRVLASHPWLRALTASADRSDRVDRFMARAESIDDIDLRVVELSGRAGEIVLTDPWLLHCRAANAGTAPRFMRSIDIYRRALYPAVFRRGAPRRCDAARAGVLGRSNRSRVTVSPGPARE